eukprot:954915-Pleurochrysis_carterae.AAC.1
MVCRARTAQYRRPRWRIRPSVRPCRWRTALRRSQRPTRSTCQRPWRVQRCRPTCRDALRRACDAGSRDANDVRRSAGMGRPSHAI